MIQRISAYNQIKNKPLSFKAKLVVDDSAYKSIKKAYEEISKFRGDKIENFNVENFVNTLKENFEKCTSKIKDGIVSLSNDEYYGGIIVQYKNSKNKRIFATIPAIELFKGKEPNHEIIANSLDKSYQKLFEKTLLPETNPFKSSSN